MYPTSEKYYCSYCSNSIWYLGLKLLVILFSKIWEQTSKYTFIFLVSLPSSCGPWHPHSTFITPPAHSRYLRSQGPLITWFLAPSIHLVWICTSFHHFFSVYPLPSASDSNLIFFSDCSPLSATLPPIQIFIFSVSAILNLPLYHQFKFSFFPCLFSSVCHSATNSNFQFFSICSPPSDTLPSIQISIFQCLSPPSAALPLIQISSFSASALTCLPLCHQFKFSFFQCLFSSVCHSATDSNFQFFSIYSSPSATLPPIQFFIFSVSVLLRLPLCHQFKFSESVFTVCQFKNYFFRGEGMHTQNSQAH